MNEIEKIKARINKRKNKININSDVRTIGENKSGKLFKIMMSIMTIYVFFMSFALYAKKDSDASMINNIFNTDFNFNNFNKTLNKLFDLRIIDNSKQDIYDQVVSSNISYINVGDDYYMSEGNLVVAMGDGVITYVNGKDEDYTIIIEYDNGVRATYNEVNEVNVFVNDRVYQNDILGSYDDKVQIIFIKDSEKITYEEVVGLI